VTKVVLSGKNQKGEDENFFKLNRIMVQPALFFAYENLNV